MNVGLCGAHRTGKTSLAEAFVKEHEGFVFLKTSASQVFKDLGLIPNVDYPFETRITVQEKILDVFEEAYKSMGEQAFISDRTPIDMIAYTLADVRQETLNAEESVRLKKYIKRCIDVSNRFFSILIVIQPGIPVRKEEGKASLCPMYIDHVAHLVMGLAVSEEVHSAHFYIPKKMTDIDRRVESVRTAVSRAVDRHARRIEDAKESGNPIVFH